LEYGGGRIRVEAPGVTLERVGMVEDLAKRFPAERPRRNSTPFRQSGRQRTFKPAIPEKRWAAIRQGCKRLQRPFQVRRFARPEGSSPIAFGRCQSSGRRGKGLTRRREGAKGFEWGNLKKTSFFFAALREIPDPISRRWMSNKLSSVIGVGTTRSAHTIGWLTHLRDLPTAEFRVMGRERKG
jgi:hypothetical protein